MDSFFAGLGSTVLQRWKAANFSLAAFPELARAALEEARPSEAVDLGNLIRRFLLEEEQPAQSMSGFGQPELIVYEHPRFYIQILFWLDGTTDIHQHEFSGAFHVLEGSSLHSHFEFLDATPVTAHFQLGNLSLKDTRLLEAGSTVPIVSGKSCIHSLFHLDSPSVTVVVRTQTDPGTGPQFTYLPPHVALDPVQADALTMRRKQLLDALERLGDPSYPELVFEMVKDLDLERGFFILQNGMAFLRSLDAWDDVWDAFVQKHGRLAERILPSLEETQRRDGLVAMRSSIEWVEHRFFLALLLNVPGRTALLELVAGRFPGDPVETVLRWAEELIEVNDSGTWLLDAPLPPELDLSEGAECEVFLAALRQRLTGACDSKAWQSLTRGDQARLDETLAQSSWSVLTK